MKKFLIVLFFCFATSCSTFQMKNKSSDSVRVNSGLVYGQNHAYLISSPEGWVLDNVAGAEAGLKVVIYPEGKDFVSAEAIMYTHATETDEDLDSFIEDDLQAFKGLSEDLKIKTGSSISIEGDKEVVLVDIENGLRGQKFERLGFLKEDKIIVLFVLSARDEDSFYDALSSYRELVKSYMFITSNVGEN